MSTTTTPRCWKSFGCPERLIGTNGWIRFVTSFILTTSLTITAAPAREDDPATHNMLVVGTEAVFLSHLPMFESVDASGTDYTSPHRYQVILQATFHRPVAQRRDSGMDVTSTYIGDRQSNPEVKMYTLSPQDFILSRVFTPAEQPALDTFEATVFRGHLERGGKRISDDPFMARVHRVIYARKFDPATEKLQQLTYVLFGSEHELFLAHLISKPPDFDQILSVKAIGHQISPGELDRGIKVIFADRRNTASERLEPGQQPQQPRTEFLLPTRELPFDLQVQPVKEFYFEEGELSMPPNFRQTDEEKKSGF